MIKDTMNSHEDYELDNLTAKSRVKETYRFETKVENFRRINLK